MNKNNFYNLRVNDKGIVETRDLIDNTWKECLNEDPNDNLEDTRQLNSILPNFKHPYLKENYSL